MMLRRMVFMMGVMVVVGGCLGQNGAVMTPDQARQQRISEHQQRIQSILAQRARQAGSENSTANSDGGQGTGTKSLIHQVPGSLSKDRVRLANWRKFHEFYGAVREPEIVHFAGEQQEYSDEWVTVGWTLETVGREADAAEVGRETRYSRNVRYSWKDESGVEVDSGVIELPLDSGTVYLRWEEQCMALEYSKRSASNMTVLRWQQPADMKYAPGSSGPLTSLFEGVQLAALEMLVVSPDYDQVVNDWRFFYRDGVLFAENAEATPTGVNESALRIGSNRGDHRPVGTMHATINFVDKLTSSVVFDLRDVYYPKTVFATNVIYEHDRLLKDVIADNGSVMDVLLKLGDAYNFEVVGSDEAREVAQGLKFTRILSSTGSNMDTIDDIMQVRDSGIVAEVVTSDTLRISVTDEYRAGRELPEFAKRLQAEYPLETRLYTIERIGAEIAAQLIEDMLNCYAVARRSETDDEGTTGAVVLGEGEFWTITRFSGAERGAATNHLKNRVCESVVPDVENGVLVVKATAGTHDRVAAWLRETGGSLKEASLGSNEAAPERRRVRVVLLEGGETGKNVAGTSVTYSAQVAAEYGLSADDLKVMGFDGAAELGRGIVDVVAHPGELGESKLSLGGAYPVGISYRDERAPYLIVDVKLESGGGEVLAENTMMLERGKPGFLGVTNLSGAVIAVLTWME